MKLCLECRDRVFGREDKKFCGDSCRNSYNNKQNKDSTNLIRNINNKLRKNYRILLELNQHKNSKTTRNNLLLKGFDFAFFTSSCADKNGTVYYFLYNQGYCFLENDWLALTEKETYPVANDTILSE
ncbi:hypothetical protein [Flavobacterium sp.]|uniref:hypothetical protein n=1 Tax=Flavobacterium sp. TaxID=239 RepID=UPI0028BE3340|nr:hypothetical protein [Flavobacterium sp.]